MQVNTGALFSFIYCTSSLHSLKKKKKGFLLTCSFLKFKLPKILNKLLFIGLFQRLIFFIYTMKVFTPL